jgi:hypothetical protein
MKKLITLVLAMLLAAGTTITAQDNQDEYLGLPGDNLNLYAVMKLFQESETIEGFERSLNDENSRINNLDLNGDNMVDYITVTDYVDGDVHNIVLRAALNRNENQDVAVFTVQRFRNGSVEIQLVGDEDLYGKNYIIEPIYGDANETPNPGYTGNRTNISVVRTTTYEVAAWPVVRFIYLPDYVVWHSSWYWDYYPGYWHPWRPFYWHYYYGYHYNWYNDYYRHYHRWNHYRYTRYNDFYYSGIRAHSPNVSVRIREGNYRTTYSHPEQRSEGEAFYNRSHPDQPSRRAENNQGRDPNSRDARSEQRQNVSERPAARTEQRQNNASERPAARTEQRQNNASERPAARTEQRQNNASERPAARTQQRENAPERPSVKAESRQRTETARPSRQPAPAAKSQAKRSSSERKATTSESKSYKSKESDKSNNSRRK